MPEEKLTYKNFNFKVDKQDENDEFFKFSGFASTFDEVDLDGDVMKPGCFASSLQKLTPKMLLMHASWKLPIGVWDKATEENHGLFVDGKMPVADDRVRGMIKPQMKIGSLDSMSIGFRPVTFKDNEHGGFDFHEVILKEISIVTFPANEGAKITTVKHFLEDDAFKEKLLELLKKDSDPSLWDSLPKDIHSIDGESVSVAKNHLVEKDGGKFLPVAAMVNDKLKAIPCAIISARAVIEKDNLGIDDEKKTEVKDVISKYYELMGFDQPFIDGSKWSLPEIKCLGKSDLEFVVRSGKLSRKSSDHIASVFLAAQEKEIDTHTEIDADLKKLDEIMNKTLK